MTSPRRKPGGPVWDPVQMCEDLRRAGVRLICADFDLTFIGIHTGGVWQKTPEALSKTVRPCLRDLLGAALESGLHVAVVTFSPQGKLISEVLASAFPTASKRIIVRALDRSWRYDGDGNADGKLPHVASVVEDISLARGETLAKKNVMLIDDDAKNIEKALNTGINAVLCRPAQPDSVYRGIHALLSHHSSANDENAPPSE